MNDTILTRYPAGARLRVKDFCRDSKAGRPGIVPFVPRTFLKLVEQGRMPQGELLGTRTRVWKVETILAAMDAFAKEAA